MTTGRLCGWIAVFCAGITYAVPVTDGLILQLNTDSRATSLVEESDAVSVWRDLSGNGNDVAQGVAGNRPVFVEQGD